MEISNFTPESGNKEATPVSEGNVETPTMVSARNFLEQVHGPGLKHVREETDKQGNLLAEVFHDPKQPTSSYEPTKLLRVVPVKGGGWEEIPNSDDRLSSEEVQKVFSSPRRFVD